MLMNDLYSVLIYWLLMLLGILLIFLCGICTIKVLYMFKLLPYKSEYCTLIGTGKDFGKTRRIKASEVGKYVNE